jgi:mitochondrial Rho GTPase 1
MIEIKSTLKLCCPEGINEEGINETGFIRLNKLFAERGRHETIWDILRAFNYTDNLSLKDSFLHPK